MRFSKQLGQVFLKNKTYLKKIASFLEIDKENVVEIGSGRGELTQFLLCAKSVACVELDPRLIQILKDKFSSFPQVRIISKDILKLNLGEIGKNLVVVGNIPFSISNYLIRYLVKNRRLIKKAFLTFQKEFAEKLVAKPKDKNYSFLSCYIQYYAQVEILFTIPKTAFSPPPKVDASFVRLIFFKEPKYKVEDEDFFFRLIKKVFSQRRKKIINVLGDKKKLISVLEELGINRDIRGDALDIEEYARIVNCLIKRKYSLKRTKKR